MFEKASRMKLRFVGYRGMCTAEDLWDIPLDVLDKMYRKLRIEARAFDEDSLLEKSDEDNELVQLKLDIMKHVVEVRLAERKAEEEKVERKARKERILEVISRKQDDALLDMDVEELQKMVDEL